jgi:hypothetical protein
MSNLLRETIHAIETRGKRVADVQWVGGAQYWMTWDEFAALADQDYDEGFGGAEVPSTRQGTAATPVVTRRHVAPSLPIPRTLHPPRGCSSSHRRTSRPLRLQGLAPPISPHPL